MALISRFQEVQRIGARKEKDSLARARSSSYGRQSFHESHGMDNAGYTNNEMQQQVVLPMEQDVDMNALRERDEQLRQLEVCMPSTCEEDNWLFLLDEHRRSERIIQGYS